MGLGWALWALERWREVRQSERRKRVRTIRDPTRIPMTTQSRSPKIDVGFESSVFTKAASYTDIVDIEKKAQKDRCLGCGFGRIGSPEFDFPAIGESYKFFRERERVLEARDLVGGVYILGEA